MMAGKSHSGSSAHLHRDKLRGYLHLLSPADRHLTVRGAYRVPKTCPYRCDGQLDKMGFPAPPAGCGYLVGPRPYVNFYGAPIVSVCALGVGPQSGALYVSKLLTALLVARLIRTVLYSLAPDDPFMSSLSRNCVVP